MYENRVRTDKCLFIAVLILAGGHLSLAVGVAEKDVLLPVPEEIRVEVLRANKDPIGRPLPLAATWQLGIDSENPSFTPAYQIRKIEEGHFIFPTFGFPGTDTKVDGFLCPWLNRGQSSRDYFRASITRVAKLRLPICIAGTQWEYLLSEKPYIQFPADQNPNVILDNGTILPKVDAFGPIAPWQEVGKKWVTSPVMKALQEWYPNPPRVFFLSNNEHPQLIWTEAETSKRYLSKYGKGRSDEFKRKVVADGWIARYRAMQAAMRDGLVALPWKNTARFIGYGAFAPCHFRGWPSWGEYGLSIDHRFDPNPLIWDGSSPSYYANEAGDYRVKSMQVECQNWVFMLDDAWKLNPDYWFEIGIWDGNNNSGGDYGVSALLKAGQTYTPDRYKGWIQYGMWIVRPRVVRDYRGWQERLNCNGPKPDNFTGTSWTNTGYTNEQFFLALCDAVDKVHTNPVLRSFWRTGELVQNTSETHPYQEATYIPAGYDDATINKNTGRWFLLTCSANPPRSTWKIVYDHKKSPILKVFSLALVQGKAPNRQWLVYAHAPLAECKAVQVTIPNYKTITIDVPVAGIFYRVDETTGKTVMVQQ